MKKGGTNPLTWVLWSTLSVVTAVTSYKAEGGVVFLPVFFLLGDGTMSFFALKAKYKPVWTITETLVSIGFAVTLIVWHYSTDRAAVWSSLIALTIACLPILQYGWQEPWKMEFGTWSFFLCATTVSYVTAVGHDIEDVGLALMSIVFNGTMLAILFFRRKCV